MVVGNETTRAVPDGATSAAVQDLTNLLDVARVRVGTVKHVGKAAPIAAQATRVVTRAVSARVTIAVAAALKAQPAGIDPVLAVSMANARVRTALTDRGGTIPIVLGKTAQTVLAVSIPIVRARIAMALVGLKVISLAVSTVTARVRTVLTVLAGSTLIVRAKIVGPLAAPVKEARAISLAVSTVTVRVRTVLTVLAVSTQIVRARIAMALVGLKVISLAVSTQIVRARTVLTVLAVSTVIVRVRTVAPRAISLAVSMEIVRARTVLTVLAVSTLIVHAKTVEVPAALRVSSPAVNSAIVHARTVVAPVVPTVVRRDSNRAATGRIASANGSMGLTEALASLLSRMRRICAARTGPIVHALPRSTMTLPGRNWTGLSVHSCERWNQRAQSGLPSTW
ncbi:hypothetical protein [Arthrobacter crystallopoietes]|uniref:hypothetical protein n=1 Tax=Crystallibacter crystallopoietes TaxID=37928 RepID=UPI0009F58091|nr:hypothetical protein [Arthrobacter crystallopoietes]